MIYRFIFITNSSNKSIKIWFLFISQWPFKMADPTVIQFFYSIEEKHKKKYIWKLYFSLKLVTVECYVGPLWTKNDLQDHLQWRGNVAVASQKDLRASFMVLWAVKYLQQRQNWTFKNSNNAVKYSIAYFPCSGATFHDSSTSETFLMLWGEYLL